VNRRKFLQGLLASTAVLPIVNLESISLSESFDWTKLVGIQLITRPTGQVFTMKAEGAI
jgi:hypothetical protein